MPELISTFAAASHVPPSATKSALAPASPRWLPPGTILGHAFKKEQHRFVHAVVRPHEPVAAGQLSTVQVQPGMTLHCAEASDLRSMTSCGAVDAGLRVLVVLDGCVDVSFNGEHVSLSVERTQERPRGALIGLGERGLFERRWVRGKFERKLSLCLSPQWLLEHGLLQPKDQDAGVSGVAGLMRQPVTVMHWQPSPRAVAVAEQLMQLCKQAGEQATPGVPVVGLGPQLLLASRALELAHEALTALQALVPMAPLGVPWTPPGQDLRLRPRDHERLVRLRSLLASEEGVQLGLPAIARRLGLSASALQRHFRAAYGDSIAAYRRGLRLSKARSALEQQGASVATAAQLAGYTSAANFATAFKRQFGVTPMQLRAHI